MANILSMDERHDRDEEFVRHYVSNGGNCSAAARSIGISESSASTTGHRMKERLWDEIEEEITNHMRGYIPKAIQNLKQLAQNADSETVRLNATRDLLDRSGLKPVEKQEIHQVNHVENLSSEQLQQELDSIREEWLGDYLREHNLEVVNTEIAEQIEAVLDHKIEQAAGKEDH